MSYEDDAAMELRELLNHVPVPTASSGITVIGLHNTVINVHPEHVFVGVADDKRRSILKIRQRGHRRGAASER